MNGVGHVTNAVGLLTALVVPLQHKYGRQIVFLFPSNLLGFCAMSKVYTEVTRTSYLQNILNSLNCMITAYPIY